MKLKKLLARSYLTLLVFLLAVLLTIFLWSLEPLRQAMMDDQVNELKELALALSVEIAGHQAPELEPLSKMLFTQARISRTRVTMIDTEGRVNFDSEGRAEEMESHRYRPEIAAALSGEIFSTVRYSDTLNRMMLYVSRAGPKIGASYRHLPTFSRPLELALVPYLRVRNQLAIIALYPFIAGGLLLYFLVRAILKPLDQMSAVIARASTSSEQVSLGPFLVSRLEPLAADLNLLLQKRYQLSEALNFDRESSRL